jgi:hypothetical protein
VDCQIEARTVYVDVGVARGRLDGRECLRRDGGGVDADSEAGRPQAEGWASGGDRRFGIGNFGGDAGDACVAPCILFCGRSYQGVVPAGRPFAPEAAALASEPGW